MNGVIVHRLRRIAQTPRTFANWPHLLADMGRPGGGPESLTFQVRSGQRISCPNRPGARVPIYEVYAEDCYRLEWFLGPLLSRPITVLDIGAHVGAFACRLAQLNPQATIRCLEPSEATAGYLRRNIADNGLDDRVSVDVRAVSDEVGYAVLDDNGQGSALNGLASDPNAGGTKVPTTTIDAIVADIGSPHVVKIDCEGGEYAAVLASSPESWANVSRLVLEYHPHSAHAWPELRDWFAAVGLTVIADEPENDRQGTAWLTRA